MIQTQRKNNVISIQHLTGFKKGKNIIVPDKRDTIIKILGLALTTAILYLIKSKQKIRGNIITCGIISRIIRD